jgi:mRNA interferase RelE/StbE
MTYSLDFDARALKEWKKLGDTVRQQFKKKLAEVLLKPRTRQTAFTRCQIATRYSFAAAGTGWFIRSLTKRSWFLSSLSIAVSGTKLQKGC